MAFRMIYHVEINLSDHGLAIGWSSTQLPDVRITFRNRQWHPGRAENKNV